MEFALLDDSLDNVQTRRKRRVLERRESKRALARVALVCRALSPFALDALWRSVDEAEVLFLLDTLPTFVRRDETRVRYSDSLCSMTKANGML